MMTSSGVIGKNQLPKNSLEYLFSITPYWETEWLKEWLNWILDCCYETRIEGYWMEFGTGSGSSTRRITDHLPAGNTLHTFDSFKGLPCDWDFFLYGGEGKYQHEPPAFDNLPIMQWTGLFEHTLIEWKKLNKGPISFIFSDSDVYSSTKSMLDGLKGQIVSGTIIAFDEYYGYRNWVNHEYKAFMEFIDETKLDFEYINRTTMYQVGIRIL